MQRLNDIKNFSAILSKSKLGKFGVGVYNALVENFPRTYYTGGTVRDFLLRKKIEDIDIATSGKPDEVVRVLNKYFIECNQGYKNLGVIIATENSNTAAIATFRKDLPSKTRYPEIKFAKSERVDSKRRDFTINSLYFSPKARQIFDFHGGLEDLRKKKIRFIGQAEKRIKEDPLRILRAMRFGLSLNFQLDQNAKKIIKKHFILVDQLSQNKINNEINKLKNLLPKRIIKNVINNPKLLDKYF